MKKTSICGLNCSDCPAHIALKKDNQELRVKTAKSWSKLFNTDIKPEDINCTGCTSDTKPLFSHCHQCEVRLCGTKKQTSNCGLCGQYKECVKIEKLHKEIPEAKEACDEKNSLKA